MAKRPVPPMSEIPPFPALSDRAAGTYNSKAFNFASHMVERFNGELIAVAESALENATEAEGMAASAEASSKIATASMQAAVAISGASLWEPGLFIPKGGSVIGPIDGHTYRKLADDGATLIDPSDDPVTWLDLTAANKNDAERASAAANVARVAAEAACDAAQLAAGVFATTAAGLAATTSGKFFNVPATETRSSLILYRNNAGVAVEMKRYPSAAGLAATVDQVTRDLLEVAGSAVVVRNPNGTLATVGTGDADWVNPPPPGALVTCDVPAIKEKYLVDKWIRFKANVGYTDGGTANSIYLRVPYSAPGEKIPAGKWVQQAMLVHLPNGGAWPQMKTQFLWSGIQALTPVFQFIEIDALTRIVFSTAQVPAATSEQLTVGSQWGIVANDWCVGACFAQVFDSEPSGLRLSLARNTHQERIARAESYIAQDQADKAAAEARLDRLEKGTAGWDNTTYAALGDSITWGAGSGTGSRSWADLLHSMLAFKSYTKLAVNGACVMPIAGRHKLSDEVAAIPLGTDLITVLIGLNDYNLGNPLGDVAAVLAKDYEALDQGTSFAEAFRFNLETIRRRFPAAHVVVILPLQTRWSRGPNPDNKSLKDFRDAERAIAQALAVPVLEAQSECGIWAGGPNLPDGGHPNDAGYELIARYMRRRLSTI